MVWMMLLPLLIVAVVVIAILLPSQRSAERGDGAMETARRRLASGEITPDDFDRIRQQLASGRTGRSQPPGLLLVAVVAFLVVLIVSLVAFAWQSGDWGWDHMGMGRMMGGGGAGPTTVLTTDDPEVAVRIRDFTYAPSRLEIRTGTRVTWTNQDSVPHSATDNAGAWDTGLFSKGQSRSRTFDSAGEYRYYCSIHPEMTATVLVRP